MQRRAQVRAADAVGAARGRGPQPPLLREEALLAQGELLRIGSRRLVVGFCTQTNMPSVRFEATVWPIWTAATSCWLSSDGLAAVGPLLQLYTAQPGWLFTWVTLYLCGCGIQLPKLTCLKKSSKSFAVRERQRICRMGGSNDMYIEMCFPTLPY